MTDPKEIPSPGRIRVSVDHKYPGAAVAALEDRAIQIANQHLMNDTVDVHVVTVVRDLLALAYDLWPAYGRYESHRRKVAKSALHRLEVTLHQQESKVN